MIFQCWRYHISKVPAAALTIPTAAGSAFLLQGLLTMLCFRAEALLHNTEEKVHLILAWELKKAIKRHHLSADSLIYSGQPLFTMDRVILIKKQACLQRQGI